MAVLNPDGTLNQHPLTLTDSDRTTLILISIYTAILLVLWHLPYLNRILWPLKLIVTALHEFGHALAGKCTGAKIESITIDADTGGLTRMRGGRACCTLPAGMGVALSFVCRVCFLESQCLNINFYIYT